ncbi:MAG: hypothetical protein ABW003_11315 [Microvirga sp.]
MELGLRRFNGFEAVGDASTARGKAGRPDAELDGIVIGNQVASKDPLP